MSTDTNMETLEIIDNDNMDNTDNLSDSDSEDTDEIDLQPYCDKMKWSEEDNKKWSYQSHTVFEEVKQYTKIKKSGKKKGKEKMFKIHYEDNRDDVWKCLKLKNWVKHNNCTADKKITFRHKFVNEGKHNAYIQAWTEAVQSE